MFPGHILNIPGLQLLEGSPAKAEMGIRRRDDFLKSTWSETSGMGLS